MRSPRSNRKRRYKSSYVETDRSSSESASESSEEERRRKNKKWEKKKRKEKRSSLTLLFPVFETLNLLIHYLLQEVAGMGQSFPFSLQSPKQKLTEEEKRRRRGKVGVRTK